MPAAVVVLLALALPAAGCFALSSVGEAVVSERDGQPCFATDPPAAMGRLQAIMVSDVSAPPSTPTWRSAVEDATAFTTSTDCVRYGLQAAGSFETQGPVVPLRVGRIYRVFLKVRRGDPSDSTLGYDAEFCVTARADSRTLQVHQMHWDRQLRRRSSAVCGVKD